MRYFLETLRVRNELLWAFGWLCLAGAVVCLLLTAFSRTEVYGANVWYKPVKFYLSVAIFSWTVGWYGAYLPQTHSLTWFSWSVTVLLSLELVYITVQASRGQASHFNTSTPFYAYMWVGMALAAIGVSIWTAYLTTRFFGEGLTPLSPGYLCAIRFGLVWFVLFSLQGLMMGSRMAHTVGGADGGAGLPVLNWSRNHGDLRIAHFLGMHALQIIPLLAHYLLKDLWQVILVALLYALVTVGVLVQALMGKPLAHLWAALG